MKSKEPDIIRLVQAAKQSSSAADKLIQTYMPFIKSETAKFINRAPIDGTDDEFSIAMFAFYEAAMAYRTDKGTFLSLAAAAIRNRLIDYYRKEKRHPNSVSLETPVYSDDDNAVLSDHLADTRDEVNCLTDTLAAKSEIHTFAKQLAEFQISMSDVAGCCPRQERTLHSCFKALEYAKMHPELLELLIRNHKLPIRQLASGSGVEKKTLERHRKYMVAILLAYTNGYEIIRGHLQQMNRTEGETL